MTRHPERGSALEIFSAFFKLGCTAFGGPVAHIGYFRDEFVERRKWLSDADYADTVALCQFLPGPASSQVGMALGARRGGLAGAFSAWIAFTLPSALLMIAAGFGISIIDTSNPAAIWAIHALKIVALAVVAQAVLQMAKNLAPDKVRASFVVVASALALTIDGAVGQLGAIAFGAVAGLFLLPEIKSASTDPQSENNIRIPISVGAFLLALFFGLLLLPALVQVPDWLRIADASFRAGSLVFGGGHVVLPLLEADTVDNGLIASGRFLAGYGMAQALPGPLFTFAAFLGTASDSAPGGVVGGALAVLAIFIPAALLLFGALPFWGKLREWALARKALTGVNAAVVGLLAAVLYDPVFTSAILSPIDIALALAAFVLLALWKVPPWAVVIGFGIGGAVLGAVI